MLSITKNVLPAVALATAFTLGFSGKAQAQHGHIVYGGHQGSHAGFHGGHIFQPVQPSYHVPGYHQPHFQPYPSHNNGWQQPQYHNTTHLDYHAPQLQWHGNHIDVQPGHYDVHQTGHWH